MRRFPEFPLVLLGFLLNFLWESVQCPWLYEGMADVGHDAGVLMCMRATLGDVNILLVAFWLVSISQRSRAWIFARDPAPLAAFVLIGVAITIAYEIVATHAGWWTYSAAMPTFLGVGLAPVLQWILIPPAIVAFMRGLVRGSVENA